MVSHTDQSLFHPAFDVAAENDFEDAGARDRTSCAVAMVLNMFVLGFEAIPPTLRRMLARRQRANKKSQPIAGLFGQIVKFAGRFGLVLLFAEGNGLVS